MRTLTIHSSVTDVSKLTVYIQIVMVRVVHRVVLQIGTNVSNLPVLHLQNQNK